MADGMKRRKLATVATVIIAAPVVTLVLGYLVIVGTPTGMEEARQSVAPELQLVAARSAKSHRHAPPKAVRAEAPQPVKPAAIDYDSACDLAVALWPTGQAAVPSFNAVMGPRAGFARGSAQVQAPLPEANSPQEWLSALNIAGDMRASVDERGELGIPVDTRAAETASRWEGGLDTVFVKWKAEALQQWLDAMEPLIYEQEWSLPPYEENWPASCSMGPLALATGAQVALLRAAARHDQERVVRYLPRCVEISLQTRLALHARTRPNILYYRVQLDDGRSLSRTLALLSELIELPEESWAAVAAQVDAAQLSGAEAEALRSAFVIRQAEGLKLRTSQLEPRLNQLHYFWDGRLQGVVRRAMLPVLRQRIDAYAAIALNARRGDARAREELAAAGDAANRASRAAQLDINVRDFFESEDSPSFPRADHANYGNETDTATIAAVLYRVRHGRRPESFEVLVPDLLPSDFPARSQSTWMIFPQGDGTALARIHPIPEDAYYLVQEEFWTKQVAGKGRRVNLIASMLFFPGRAELDGIARYLVGS